jgi:dTDP-4-amino-4,6-dideoxygalactose transaminase
MTNKLPFLPFALPDISEAEIASVVETLRSGWITTGPKAKEFEQRFARATAAPHAVMVNSCTAALHLALDAVGIKPGDEVIVPTVTFAATAEVVRYLNAIPVLVDVRKQDHNIDPAAVERAITPKTRAILPVHFAGVPADMDEITALARGRGIRVIDDAAHCFPGSYKGRPIGTLADISCFSFYATKTITTAEGGAAVTANADWADRMRIMSLHGISRDAWKRYSAEGNWYYEIIAPGYKYNMTDMAAALGLGQLERASAMRERRRTIADAYDAAFGALESMEVMARPADREHSHHLYVLKLRDGVLEIDRDQFIVELKERGIGTSVHFIPLHMHPYYRDNFGYAPGALPVAADLYRRTLSLPIYTRMTDADIERVVEAVLDIERKSRRIKP